MYVYFRLKIGVTSAEQSGTSNLPLEMILAVLLIVRWRWPFLFSLF